MKEILLSACGAYATVNMVQFHLLIKVNRKPINCATCLAGWFCLVMTFQTYYWMEIPGMMAAAMMMSVLFNSIMKKL
jgi:hypothetical protein